MIDRQRLTTVLGRIAEVESALGHPDTLATPRLLKAKVREHAALKRLETLVNSYFRTLDEIDQHRQIVEDPRSDAELRALAAAELPVLQAALPAAEHAVLLALLPPDPSASGNALLEIRAGTGGDEAGLFAGDLLRMYSRYGDKRGWKVEVLDASPGEMGGYKEAVCLVSGEGAYGTLRFESGTHRVQRVPATEAQGRIHTSAATVAVFPESADEDDFDIPASDLRLDIFCAGGHGGQGVNTTYSAVRLTHLPTGLVAQCQDGRSQHRNKEKALAVLKARILDQRRAADEARMGKTRRDLIGSGDRSQKIRTYNFPQNRLTDHRIGLTLYALSSAMQGEIDDLLAALRDHDLNQRLETELA